MPLFSEIKSKIINSWTDEIWSDRMADRDYGETRDYVTLTKMIAEVAAKGDFSRAVEIGCGDGKYSAFLRSRIPSIKSWIATDIDGPRIKRARQEIPDLTIEVASILDCIARYNEPGTLFFSANVFGNIVPDEMQEFYRNLNQPGTGLAFLAGGLPIERDEMYAIRPNGIAFDHNFFALTRESGLSDLGYRIRTYGDTNGTIAYWMTGIVPR